MHRISISVQTEPNSTSSLNKQTRDLNHANSLTSMQWTQLSITSSEPKQPYQKLTTYKVRVAYSNPVHAAMAGIGRPGLNHGAFS